MAHYDIYGCIKPYCEKCDTLKDKTPLPEDTPEHIKKRYA